MTIISSLKRLFASDQDLSSAIDQEMRGQIINHARDGHDINSLAAGITDKAQQNLSEEKAVLLKELAAIDSAPPSAINISVSALTAKTNANIEQINGYADNVADEIMACAERLRKGEAEYKAFLARRNLSPGKPQGACVISLVGIFTFSLVEGMLTGSIFFQSGIVPSIQDGIILGVMAAGSVAGIAAYGGGHLIGRHFHLGATSHILTIAEKQGCWLARITAPLLIIILVMIHGSLATARAEETLDQVTQIFVENPSIILKTLETSLLFVIGLTASVLAWVKGMTAFGDRHPGRAQAYQAAIAQPLQDLEEVKDNGFNAVDEIQQNALAELDTLSEMIEEVTAEHADIISEMRSRFAIYHDHVENSLDLVDREHDTMLAIYKSIAGRRPATFKRIDKTKLRAFYQIDWQQPDFPSTDTLKIEIATSQTRIISAATEARALISASLITQDQGEN